MRTFYGLKIYYNSMGKLIDINGLKTYNEHIQAQFEECTRNMVFVSKDNGATYVTNHSMAELLKGHAFLCSQDSNGNITPLEPVIIKAGDQTVYMVREIMPSEFIQGENKPIAEIIYKCKEEYDANGAASTIAYDGVTQNVQEDLYNKIESSKCKYNVNDEILEIS